MEYRNNTALQQKSRVPEGRRTWAEITLIILTWPSCQHFSSSISRVGFCLSPSPLASECSQVHVLSSEILTTWSRVGAVRSLPPSSDSDYPPPLPITHLDLSGPKHTHHPPPYFAKLLQSILPSSLNLGPSNS